MEKDFKKFLDAKVACYNNPDFIANDPISVPHRFRLKQDIEIAGFFAAVFAWGNRTTIIQKSRELMQRMDDAPYDFITGHHEKDLKKMLSFRHRTFNDTDLLYFISFLRHHYQRHDSLEDAFCLDGNAPAATVEAALTGFYHYFFSLEEVPNRTRKHIATPERHSSCKRLNMYLRWMVRQDAAGVDFGLWTKIRPAQLICPLDVHVLRVARRFQLLERNVADWNAAVMLTRHLRKFNAADPVKYDFALFGLGVIEKY